jgi:hypothetical protein
MFSSHKKLIIGLAFLSVSLLLFPASASIGTFAFVIVTPSAATNRVGETHTVTATVWVNNGSRLSGITVTFKIIAGPNTGLTGTGVTNSNGEAKFSWTSTLTGHDWLNATATSPFDGTTIHGEAWKEWIPGLAIPEFWLGPALGLTGFFAALGVFQLFRRRERRTHMPPASS